MWWDVEKACAVLALSNGKKVIVDQGSINNALLFLKTLEITKCLQAL